MIVAWLPFITIGELRERMESKAMRCLRELNDAQHELIEIQQEEIRLLRRRALVEARFARDVADLAVEVIAAPTETLRNQLARLARDIGHRVAREEEHSL